MKVKSLSRVQSAGISPPLLFDLVGFFFFFFSFWPCHASCWILAPQSEVELVPPALEAQSLNHWTAREVLVAGFLNIKCGSLPSKILRCLKVFKQQN